MDWSNGSCKVMEAGETPLTIVSKGYINCLHNQQICVLILGVEKVKLIGSTMVGKHLDLC